MTDDENDGEELEIRDQQDETVTEYYFVGNEIQHPVEDAMLILQHGPPENDATDEREWTVLKCAEAMEVPSDLDLQLCVYQESAVVETDEVFQTHVAWALTRDEIDDLGNADEISRTVPFPTELRGDVIPEQSRWDDDDLEHLLLPFSV